MGTSQAWFYTWVHGDLSPRRARRAALAAQVRVLFINPQRRYGSPRITAEVRAHGWRVSANTVAQIMREQNLVARPSRRRRSLTKPDRCARTAPDLVRRDF